MFGPQKNNGHVRMLYMQCAEFADAKGVAELRMHPLARRGGDLTSGSSSCIGSPIKVALLKRLHQHHHTRATLMNEETRVFY